MPAPHMASGTMATKHGQSFECVHSSPTKPCCGWQEVSVGGQDVVYKDIIEPLESVSVAITPSDKDDITLYGEPLDVSALQAALTCTWMRPAWLLASSHWRRKFESFSQMQAG